jgi:hypothetical protein
MPCADRWSPTPQYDVGVAPKEAPKRPLRREKSDRNFQPILEKENKQDEKEDDYAAAKKKTKAKTIRWSFPFSVPYWPRGRAYATLTSRRNNAVLGKPRAV